MPLDAICLRAVSEELSGRVTGMRIDKVHQPERDMLILQLRGASGSSRLLISAGSGDARIHLTEHRPENPVSPPMFCMLLRKHITGARITGITQIPAERVLELRLEAPDAIGVITDKRLIVEMIGRFSNIILVSGDGIIIDCLRRTGGEMTDKRAVLPGLLYRLPPPQESKYDPMSITEEKWQELFESARVAAYGNTVDKWLISAFSAMSPLICRELSYRAYYETDRRFETIIDGGVRLRGEFFKLISEVNSGVFEPVMIKSGDMTPYDYSYTVIGQYEGAMSLGTYESFSELLDEFYTESARKRRVKQRASAMAKTVKTARDRTARKLSQQHAELAKTEQRDSLRECGDIITANFHNIRKGQNILAAQDFYSEDGALREIALDPLRTPQQNAAKYYKDYTKAKNAAVYLSQQISLGESELIYLQSVADQIELAEEEGDMSEIRSELEQTGYLKAHKPGREKTKKGESPPMRFASSAGLQIQAGRSNIQNDRLTLKTADKSDVWLHASKVHGSHVILSCRDQAADDTSLMEAAAIAAYYSAARGSGKVPVDHTQVRNVRKQPGGRPGMVIYTQHKTIIASPDEELVRRLRRG